MTDRNSFGARTVDSRPGQWGSPLGNGSRAAVAGWDVPLGLGDRILFSLALWFMLGMVAVGVLTIRYLPQLLAVGAGLIAVVLVASGLR